MDPGRVPASGAYGVGHGRRPLRQKLVACKVLVPPEVACGVVPVPSPEKDRPSNPAAPADARRGFRV